MKINKRALRITLSLVAISGLTAALGNACSQLQAVSTGNMAASIGTGTCAAATAVPAFVAVNGAPTPSMLYGTNGTNSNVVQSYLACLGLSITNLSQTTLNDITARSPNFPATNYIGNVSSASLMALAAVAYDIAADLVTYEASLPANQRNFTPSVDFTGATTISTAATDDVLNRVVGSCAARAPSSVETSATEQAVNALNSTPTNDVVAIIGSFLASYSGFTQ